MSAPSEVARSLRCGRCNGSFALAAIEQTVRCPYCGYRQNVARHGELHAYEEAVRRRVAAADEQHMVAASLQAWTASRASSPKRKLAVVYGLIVGVPLALALVLIGLNAIGVLPKQRGPGLTVAIGGASYFGLVVFFVWSFTGRARIRQRSAELEQSRVACPTCGAPGLLTPGDSVDSCQYCHAALVPSPALIDRGIDAARAALRAASIDRRRALREATAKAHDVGIFGVLMPVVMIGSLVLMIGGTAVGFSVEMLRGKEPFNPAIFILWAMTLGVLGAVVVYQSRRKQRRAKLRGTIADVVRQLGGDVLPEIDQRVAWLNRFWTGDYDQRFMNQTYVACAAGVLAGGYPVLVDVDLHAGKPPPRLDLLLAAWVPNLSDGKEPSERVKDRPLSALGFHVRKSEAGLTAHANKELLEACLRDPDAVHVVVPALSQLARMARELGCESVAE